MSLGWETSDTDIEQALGNLCMPNGVNDVEEVFTYLDTDRVESAALYGADMFEQTEFAIQDIEEQISLHC
jgi:hypothetical protein